ncbi:gamma-aminobutyric acid receptor subunit beta-like isoform X2 [Symsagittifera roscoffensis]|uniref:gamma-aminobutyric acid receptor subunit beta-like isoform X2 n=1 Tax=Symsagittifera roscoffensis TaxID=84072 RepID=UPI00307BED4E
MTAKAASSFTSLHFLPFSLDRIVVLFVFIHFEMFFNGVMALKLETNRALKLQEEYNKHLRPNHKGKTDNVTVGIRIYSIGPISETEMTMSFDCYFRLLWKDARLIETARFLIEDRKKPKTDRKARKHAESIQEEVGLVINQTTTTGVPSLDTSATKTTAASKNQSEEEAKKKSGPVDFVLLGEEYAEAIWSPDLFFPDSVDIERPGKGILSDSSVLVLYLNGDVFRSMRLQVKSRCKMDLTLFPMDVQVCDVCVESYQYHSLDVNISWGDEFVILEKDKVRKYGTANFDIIYDNFYWRRETQINFNYPYVTLCLTIELRRKLSIYLITIYLPSISLVVLSWVGFWIDKRAVPARASLTITTILAQITLITGAANQFPGIADLKLVDLYLIVNFFYVFASLIEFALVSYEPPVKSIGKSWLQNTRERMRMMNAKMPTESPREGGRNNNNNKMGRLSGLIRPKKMSKGSMGGGEGDTMTYCNTVVHQMRKDAAKTVVHTEDDLDKSMRDIVSSQNIKATLEGAVRIDSEPTILNSDDRKCGNNGASSTFKPHNGFQKLKPSEPKKQATGMRALKDKCKESFTERNADDVSKIIFPTTFIFWNLIYFGMSFHFANRFNFDNSS